LTALWLAALEKAGNRSLKKNLDPIVGFFQHFRNKSKTTEEGPGRKESGSSLTTQIEQTQQILLLKAWFDCNQTVKSD